MAEHTKGPWAVSPEPMPIGVYGSDGMELADCCAIRRPDEENDANARRIVACVNACEGLPTAALEELQPGDLLRLHQAIADSGPDVLVGQAGLIEDLAQMLARLIGEALCGDVMDRTVREAQALLDRAKAE